MRGGQLDRRVTIERPFMIEDPDYGPQPGGWELVGVARMPAQVMDVLPSKNEATVGGVKLADRPARLRMRYMAGITSDMRITLHGATDVVFQISGGPAEIGRREWIELTIEAYSA